MSSRRGGGAQRRRGLGGRGAQGGRQRGKSGKDRKGRFSRVENKSAQYIQQQSSIIICKLTAVKWGGDVVTTSLASKEQKGAATPHVRSRMPSEMQLLLDRKKGQASEPPAPTSVATQFNAFRVMNLDELASHLQLITAHSGVCGSSCVIEGETYRAGLACIVQARSSKCNATFSIPSSSHFVGSDRRKVWTVNLGAVLGQIATGGSAARLQQVMALVGVPSMSKPTFTSTERYIAEHLQAQLAESMIAAGKEKRRLAIENDEHFQGVPAITVIADGGWSKRSHKHSYNAKSGVAVIIGSRTKKLLFLGVRNKYCSTCSIAENAGQEAPEHMCYRIWAGSSPAMESGILVEGFGQAEKTRRVRYMHLIGDGDSSVLTSIYERVPVWGRYVRKIECVNRALKNYRAKLETIVKESHHTREQANSARRQSGVSQQELGQPYECINTRC